MIRAAIFGLMSGALSGLIRGIPVVIAPGLLFGAAVAASLWSANHAGTTFYRFAARVIVSMLAAWLLFILGFIAIHAVTSVPIASSQYVEGLPFAVSTTWGAFVVLLMLRYASRLRFRRGATTMICAMSAVTGYSSLLFIHLGDYRGLEYPFNAMCIFALWQATTCALIKWASIT